MTEKTHDQDEDQVPENLVDDSPITFDPDEHIEPDEPDEALAAEEPEGKSKKGDGEITKDHFEVVEVTKLVQGSNPFKAGGWSYVPSRTVDGKVRMHKVPIQPLPSDVTDNLLEHERPEAPKNRKWVEAGSQAAEEWNMPQGGKAWVHDFTDKTFKMKHKAWLTRRAWATLAYGIACKLVTENGKEATNLEEKIQVVKNLEMTDAQFTSIISDIVSLTTLKKEERMAFFGSGSDSKGNSTEEK